MKASKEEMLEKQCAKYLGLDELIIKPEIMLRWSTALIIIAIIIAILGFSGITGVSMEKAEILFFMFIILFILSLIIDHLYIKKNKN